MTTKIRLLTATTLAAVSSVAYAQTAAPTLPAVELRGAGATAVGPATAITLNCIGNPGTNIAVTAQGGRGPAPTGSEYWYYGTNSNQALFQTSGLYLPTTPTSTNPQLDCATQTVQPNFQGKYVGTGSGTGRTWWRSFANQLTGGTNINPFTRTDNGATPGTEWTNLQFAFSEGPISTADLTTYNTNAAPTAKAAIQIPFYVVPVALAYPPRYGIRQTTTGPVSLNFNVKVPVKVLVSGTSTVVGGLRLDRNTYCKIFNGEITNWNDAAIQRLNGGSATNPGTPLFDASDDTSARWTSEGLPIRLVGRLDSSGTSNIFIRHLTAVCTPFVTTNKFQRAGADSLPYNTGSSINLSGFLSTTRYFPGNTSTSIASNVQSLSGAVYDRGTDTIVTTQGNEAAGLFMVADGNSGVEAAIASENPANLVNSTTAGIQLNGKFGYVSTDWVVPAPSRTLLSVALPAGASTTSFVVASVANGLKAFGTILPPQTTATSGAFSVNDSRTSLLGGTVQRARPQDWANVLYPDAAGVTGLAVPTAGYPITGVSFMLLYTCYNTTAKRLAVVNTIATVFGKQTRVAVARAIGPSNPSTSVTLSANTFKGTAPTGPGIITNFGLGVVPAAWQNAINETFLRRSTQSSIPTGGGTAVLLRQLSATPALNGTDNGGLWIQSALPTAATQFDGVAGTGLNADVLSNPSCTAGQGA